MARILILDDDIDILKMTKQMLSSEGHEVFTESQIPKATNQLLKLPFDLIISDVKMPPFSGFDLAKILKRSKKFEKIPIVILTSLRDAKDVEKALRIGVDDYIIKPFDPMLLTRKVENILREQSNPLEKVSIHFSKASSLIEAKLLLNVKIVSLSEDGIEMECSQNFKEGQIVEIESSFFEELHFSRSPKLRVFSSSFLEKDNVWKMKCSFFGLEEKVLQKIRAWVYSEQMKNIAGTKNDAYSTR